MSEYEIDQLRAALSRAIDRERKLEPEIGRLRAELAQERLRYGQQRARNTVLMMALGHLAREGQVALAQRAVRLADEAAARVRLEDFTVAKVTKGSDK